MISFFQNKMFLLGILVILLVAIPLTVYMLQKQQETRSHATAATTIYFAQSGSTNQISTFQATIGDTLNFDIYVNPGSNIVDTVKMVIDYDMTKLKTASAVAGCGTSICSSGALPNVLTGPTYTKNGTTGTITYELNSGSDLTKLLQSTTKIATLTLTATATADATSPTQLSFEQSSDPTDTSKTYVSSKNCNEQQQNCNDLYNQNVLQTALPLYITIVSANQPTPSATPSPSTSTTGTTTQSPVCSSLTTDRTPSGNAPFSLTFTATGNDPDGTIAKATFNFGDGPIQDITQGSGIGTNAVSLPIAHTYTNPGTYAVSATFTDNDGAVSSPSSCTQTVTVLSATGSTGSGGFGGIITPTPGIISTGSATLSPTGTLIAFITPTPIAQTGGGTGTTQIPPTGPNNTILNAGIFGTIITVIGGVLFFTL